MNHPPGLKRVAEIQCPQLKIIGCPVILARLSEEFAPRPAILPSVAVTLPTLASYDELMEVCA